jgi:hydroxymethylglutaryl-CoA reductase (NADPH)
LKNERISKILGSTKLPDEISKNLETDQLAYEKNCENVIGSIQVPVGIAGPINLDGKRYLLPVATTEAALVASINRGCKAVSVGNNLDVKIKKIGITRAPVYKVKKIKSTDYYKNWFRDNLDRLQSLISEKSRFTKILKFEIKKYKGLLYVKFYFDTGDAMGMNMATIACESMNSLICSELNATCLALSSNFCSDKKPSLVNLKQGRGYNTTAQIELSAETIESILKTNIKSLKQTYTAKLKQGSKLAKAFGYNSHHANIIAGIFLATGQDLAHTVEGSLGSTELKFFTNKIIFKVNLPCLVCGTVGGGTKLKTQKEALNMIGLSTSGIIGESALEFAKVVSVAVLAGEISLLASLSEGTLAKAHDSFR